MSGFADRMTEKSPFLRRAAERSVRSLFGTSLSDNIVCTSAAVFACGLSAIAAEPLRKIYPFAFAAMVLAWVTASCSAGFLKQFFFPFYSAAFWFIPHLFIDAAQSPTRAEEFTAFNEALARFAELITVAAPRLLTEDLNTGRLAVSEGFFIGSCVFFAAGFIVRRTAKQSRFYCEMRLKLIQEPNK